MNPLRILAYCEASDDFELARDLIDRVLVDEGPEWIATVLEAAPDSLRRYEPRGGFGDVHRYGAHALELGVGVPHGHFDGRPGAAGALMARTIFAIGRKLDVDAVVLVWDMDQQASERRLGLRQAADEARRLQRFLVVIGAPNIMREAWVLAGFVARGAQEETALRELRQELGFSPVERATSSMRIRKKRSEVQSACFATSPVGTVSAKRNAGPAHRWRSFANAARTRGFPSFLMKHVSC